VYLATWAAVGQASQLPTYAIRRESSCSPDIGGDGGGAIVGGGGVVGGASLQCSVDEPHHPHSEQHNPPSQIPFPTCPPPQVPLTGLVGGGTVGSLLVGGGMVGGGIVGGETVGGGSVGAGGGTVGAVGPDGVILTSAQFQNCSGTPFPSGGIGPQRLQVLGCQLESGQSYPSYPGWIHEFAVM